MSEQGKTGDSPRIIALDYGRVHTGVAVSDPTGTITRPLPEVLDAGSKSGMRRISDIIREERAGLVIVGMPVSLSGEMGAQAKETGEFIERLRGALTVPVRSWDERFTSRIAREKGRHAVAGEHSIAACCLLEDFLGSEGSKSGC